MYLNPLRAGERGHDSGSRKRLEQLEDRVRHHRLRIKLGRRRLPVSIATDQAKVVIGARTWFEDLDGYHPLFAVESWHLAGLLFELSEDSFPLRA